MTSVTPKLRYLLAVLFEDGTILEQTLEDVSTKDPTKSFWYDVITNPSPVRRMALTNDFYGGSKVFTVDLLIGKMYIGVTEFFPQPCENPLPSGGIFTPVYLRDNYVLISNEEVQSHTHKYRIGWKYVVSDYPFRFTSAEGELGIGEEKQREFIQTIVID